MSKKLMLEALEVSKQALPHCEPNPPVGCVLVKDGEVISKSFTQAGHWVSHAEGEALNAYSGDLSSVTAYVTLEPCSFVGLTAACASSVVGSSSGQQTPYQRIIDRINTELPTAESVTPT